MYRPEKDSRIRQREAQKVRDSRAERSCGARGASSPRPARLRSRTCQPERASRRPATPASWRLLTAVLGTDRPFTALQRFRPVTEVLPPSPARPVRAPIDPKCPCGVIDRTAHSSARQPPSSRWTVIWMWGAVFRRGLTAVFLKHTGHLCPRCGNLGTNRYLLGGTLTASAAKSVLEK
jgi:hypothetical protein